MQRTLIGRGARGTAIVVLVVVLILTVVNGCSRGSGSTETSSGGETQAPSSTTSERSLDSSDTDSANKEYAVGDTVYLSDRTLKVNEAQSNYLPLNPSSRPEPGNQVVRVNVAITNTSSGQVSFTPFDFNLEDDSGVQRGHTIAVDMPNPLNTGNLAPNNSVTANIAFEVPQEEAGFKLIYKPIAFSSETATVHV